MHDIKKRAVFNIFDPGFLLAKFQTFLLRLKMRTHHSGFGNQMCCVWGFHLQISDFCTAKSWQGGWGDLFSKSLWLPQLPKGLFPSVLGPSGGRRGGLFLCCWAVADKRVCYCVSAWWETYWGRILSGCPPFVIASQAIMSRISPTRVHRISAFAILSRRP